MATAETKFEALGREWRFKFGIGAMCRLERAMGGTPFAVVMREMLPSLGSLADLEDPVKLDEAMEMVRVTHVVALLAAGLDESEAMAVELIDELGLDKAVKLIFGRAEDDLPAEKPGSKKAEAPRRPSRS